jgi:hypothetical protein
VALIPYRIRSRSSLFAVFFAAPITYASLATAQPAPVQTAPAPPAPAPAASAPAASAAGASAPAGSAAGASAPAASSPSQADDVAALRQEVRGLRADIDALKAAKTDPSTSLPAAPPPPRPLGYESFWPWVLPPEGISGYAYIQGQYETHQDSQDQLSPSGQSLNYDRFSIRRARATAIGEWQYAAMVLELDANTTSGPQVDLRKAEASLQYRPDRSLPPIAMATLGLFDAPFGYELDESPRTRFFMERTTASRALFPGEPDLGLRIAGAASFFRWTLAVLNGNPLGESSGFAEQDPISPKDVSFRFGVDTRPLPELHVAGGMSALRGRGFHAGTSPTGSSLQWHDVNNDGAVQPAELAGVPAQGATPSQTFDRWAVGADLRMNYKWWLGVAKIYGEFVVAQNYDRGLYVADPIATGIDTRELGYYVAAQQEILQWGEVGLRYDLYDPNSNAFDKRGGNLIPFSEAITTISPMAAVVLPDRARLILQYDAIHNAYARNSVGVPTNLKDNVVTLRLQVQL